MFQQLLVGSFGKRSRKGYIIEAYGFEISGFFLFLQRTQLFGGFPKFAASNPIINVNQTDCFVRKDIRNRSFKIAELRRFDFG